MYECVKVFFWVVMCILTTISFVELRRTQGSTSIAVFYIVPLADSCCCGVIEKMLRIKIRNTPILLTVLWRTSLLSRSSLARTSLLSLWSPLSRNSLAFRWLSRRVLFALASQIVRGLSEISWYFPSSARFIESSNANGENCSLNYNCKLHIKYITAHSI